MKNNDIIASKVVNAEGGSIAGRKVWDGVDAMANDNKDRGNSLARFYMC